MRKLDWKKAQDPAGIVAVLIATALGAGLLPMFPGTFGTIVGIPIAYLTSDWNWPPRVALWAALLALGTWAATEFDRRMKTADNQNIVIDEVVGLGITAWTAGTHASTLFAAFVLFRFFDILKPPPVRQVDRWSKTRSKAGSPVWGGFGVMADDVVAGFQGLAVIWVLQHFGILP